MSQQVEKKFKERVDVEFKDASANIRVIKETVKWIVEFKRNPPIALESYLRFVGKNWMSTINELTQKFSDTVKKQMQQSYGDLEPYCTDGEI